MINNMIKTKGYVLATEVEEYVFLNESDRNEMALAVYQEDVLNRFNIEANWYTEHHEEMLEFYTEAEIFARMLSKCIVMTSEDIWTYDTIIMEG